jgi:excisionase family DNA binding protein
MEKLLTLPEVADLLGCKIGTVRTLIAARRLPAVNLSTGAKNARYRVRTCDLEAFLTPAPIVEKRLPNYRRTRLDAGVERVY